MHLLSFVQFQHPMQACISLPARVTKRVSASKSLAHCKACFAAYAVFPFGFGLPEMASMFICSFPSFAYEVPNIKFSCAATSPQRCVEFRTESANQVACKATTATICYRITRILLPIWPEDFCGALTLEEITRHAARTPHASAKSGRERKQKQSSPRAATPILRFVLSARGGRQMGVMLRRRRQPNRTGSRGIPLLRSPTGRR